MRRPTGCGEAYDLGARCRVAETAATGTEGLEDLALPGPGAAFFYLVEY